MKRVRDFLVVAAIALSTAMLVSCDEEQDVYDSIGSQEGVTYTVKFQYAISESYYTFGTPVLHYLDNAGKEQTKTLSYSNSVESVSVSGLSAGDSYSFEVKYTPKSSMPEATEASYTVAYAFYVTKSSSAGSSSLSSGDYTLTLGQDKVQAYFNSKERVGSKKSGTI